MSDQPVPHARKVFLSYASEDAPWMKNFTDDEVFRNVIGRDVRLENYADTVNVGPIKAWLNERIDASAAVILFLSEHYIAKEFTLQEFWTSLAQQALRRLVFVPVMMDADAIGWWTRRNAEGRLNELKSEDGSDYAFAEFTHNGKRQEIFTNGRFNDGPARRITELALLIKDRLKPPAARAPTPAPVVGPQPAPAAGQPVAGKPIVLLGHATAGMPPDVAAQSGNLHAALKGAGLSVTTWADRWYAQPLLYRPTAPVLLGGEPVFVQPVGPGEAGYLADDPDIERGWLKKVVGKDTPEATKVDQCRLVLWLPKDVGDDDDFQKARPALPTILSRETVSELTDRLRQDAGGGPPVPVIMLEFMRGNVGLGKRLLDEFRKVVEQEVSPPVESYDFDADLANDLLEQQIANVPGDRVILAVHDLNVGPAKCTAEARIKLDTKLRAYMNRVDKAQTAKNRKGLKLFWSALVVRNGALLPFVRHPSPDFDNWYMLTFVNQEGTPNDNERRPDPTRRRIFSDYLRDWART